MFVHHRQPAKKVVHDGLELVDLLLGLSLFLGH